MTPRIGLALSSLSLVLAGCALPGRTPAEDAHSLSLAGLPSAEAPPAPAAAAAPVAPLAHDAGHTALWYIPNRISDLLDILRARVRVGPGLNLSGRFTEAATFNLGGYESVFVGIPGPRREARFNWPFGFDSTDGSPIGTWGWSGHAPAYGQLEIGLGTQILIVGADLGLDVYEAFDFITGIVTIDPIGDDV